ncbi:MAG: DegQ family serine endoprotease [Gammaproteobacteria bacterium]|nr:DegQ family serine endoprotease [Gammaproteobacteria bacterium]
MFFKTLFNGAKQTTVNTSPSQSSKRLRIARKGALLVALLPFIAVTSSYADSLPNFSALIEQEGDAVVKISVVTESSQTALNGIPGVNPEDLPELFRRFYEQLPQNPGNAPRQGAGFGSGFIISEDGYVITNAHVVNDAVDIRVGLEDQREFEATLIGSDKASDIALLKLDAKNLPTVQIGDSDSLKVGEWVLAIGSPFGFEHTATQGIVSALSRSLPSDTYVPFIQTDVAVNPGNSGGPLFNTDGKVIGVNSQIYSRSGGYQGLSFAIPINVAMSIADQLKEKGYATRGWLGVMIQNVDQALAKSFGLDKPGGALVSMVTEGSPAMRAQLQPGDVILEFNGQGVANQSTLPPLVGAVPPGTTVDLIVMRDGKRKTIEVTIDALDADTQARAAIPAEPAEADKLGAVVKNVPEERLAELGIDNGVVITELDPSGAAAEAGLLNGDVIVALNRKPIESTKELDSLLEDLPTGTPVPVLVQRQQSPLFLALTINEQG